MHFKVRFQSALIHKTSAAVSHAGCRQDRCSKVELSITTLMQVHISSAFIHEKANKRNTMVWIMGDHAEMKGSTVLGILNGRTHCSYNMNFKAMVIKHTEESQHLRCCIQHLTLPKYSFDTTGNVRNNLSYQKPHWKHMRTRARMLKGHRTRAWVYASRMHSVPQETIHTTASAVVTSCMIPHKGKCYMDNYIHVAKRPVFSKNIITIYSEASHGVVSCLPQEFDYPGLEKSEREIQITSQNSLKCLRTPQLMQRLKIQGCKIIWLL